MARNKKEVAALSPSVAEILIHRSPMHAHYFHRLLGGHTKPSTAPMDEGKLIHSLVLEGGKDIVVVDADSYRSKEARFMRDAVVPKGGIPVLRTKYEGYKTAADAIKDKIQGVYGLPVGDFTYLGKPEVRLEWTEYSDHGPVLCHGVLDWLTDDWTHIYDLKCVKNAHPLACAAQMVRFSSAMQEAAYKSAVRTLKPELAGRVEMTFLFAETGAPFAVTPGISAGSMRELGESQWHRAVNLWGECMKTGLWPSYVTEPVALHAPAWAVQQAMMEEVE